MKLDEKKLDELMVYLCQRCGELPAWGRTKLFKLLYFSDFNYYRQFGFSISGASYFKLVNGPVPKVAYKRLEALDKQGKLAQVPNWVGDKQEIRPLALVEAQLSVFKPEEISVIDRVIADYGNLNATQLSELSHSEHGWLIVEPDEEIPYETAFGAPPKLTEPEVDFFRALIEKQDALQSS